MFRALLLRPLTLFATLRGHAVHFECRAGALKAAVALRAQIASGPVAPVDVPAPPVQPPVPSPPGSTFQLLPPRPAPASN